MPSQSKEEEIETELTEETEKTEETEETPLDRTASSSSSSSYLGKESQFENLPQEIFVEICENSHPEVLYSLTLVCKKFRTILWSDSATTQQIWNKSRMKFISRHSDLKKPPGDLSEQKFVWLLSMGKECQYCHRSIEGKDRKVYWEFRVLICPKCAHERMISLKDLRELYGPKRFPEEILPCLPCISETVFRNSNELNYLVNVTSPGYYGTNPYYWEAGAITTIGEYESLNKGEKASWLNKKQREMREFMTVIDGMRAKEDNLQLESLFKYICP